MAKTRSRLTYPGLLALTVLSVSRPVLAALSLQDLQPIANFPPACQAAYQNPISSCPDASAFTSADRSSSGSICSRSCVAALKSAVDSIRQACQGTSAPPGTIIAHAFTGDLPYAICFAGDGGSSQSATNAVTSTYSSSDSTSSTADSTSTPSSTLSSATESTTSESSSSSSSTSRSSSSSSSSISTSSSSTKSSQSSTLIGSSTETITLSGSSTASKTTSKPSEPTLLPGGGGSPFDQTVPNAASPKTANHAAIPSMIGLAVLAVWAV